MKFPIFQLCVHYSSESNNFGLVFPQESENFLSMTFAIPVTYQDFLVQKIQSEFYFPSLQGSEQKNQNLKFNGVDNLNTVIYNKEIKFNLIKNFPYRFVYEDNPNIIQSFFILNYVGQFRRYTDRFLGFIPITPTKKEGLNSIFNEHEFAFVGFTPKFGNRDWLEK